MILQLPGHPSGIRGLQCCSGMFEVPRLVTPVCTSLSISLSLSYSHSSGLFFFFLFLNEQSMRAGIPTDTRRVQDGTLSG